MFHEMNAILPYLSNEVIAKNTMLIFKVCNLDLPVYPDLKIVTGIWMGMNGECESDRMLKILWPQ